MDPKRPRVFSMSFGSVYPLYVQKAERKGRTKEEVDAVIRWLTGYGAAQLAKAVEGGIDLEGFFARAPRPNPDAALVTGVVCGVRVEEVADPLMRRIRQLDKLVDELAKGKALASILDRAATPPRSAAPPRAPRARRASRGTPPPAGGPPRARRRSSR